MVCVVAAKAIDDLAYLVQAQLAWCTSVVNTAQIRG
jgi:hypothetical protein